MEIIEKYFSDFNALQLEQFSALKELYIIWNEKINVISRKDIESLYLKHVLHSLSIAVVGEFVNGQKIIDIGTGGGFPGIPLAILFPEVEFLLVDSIAKKIKVVDEISSALQLKNVRTLCGRAEDVKEKKQFDYAVSRAVAPLQKLWQWSAPLIKGNNAEERLSNGLICLKGGDLHQEISESGCRPMVWEINSIFNEDYFNEKVVLFVKK